MTGPQHWMSFNQILGFRGPQWMDTWKENGFEGEEEVM